MRIERIAIDGFGIWHDATFRPAPGLTVLLGDNEAGKTTLLAFVRAMLFGFEVNRYPALSGGRRGGVLDVVTAEGRRYRIERYGERGGEGKLVVRDDTGEERPAAQLTRLLHGVESAVYRNVFAFRLEELTEFRGLTEGDIASRIYGAGLGTGGASALAIEERMRREAGDSFKSGGQNPIINQLLKQLEETGRELDALDIPSTYADTKRRLAGFESTRLGLSHSIAALEAERRSVERITAGWDAWIVLGSATEALAALPAAAPIPQDAMERLTRIEFDLRAAAERVEAAARRRASIEQQLSETPPDRELLGRRDDIAAILTARDVDRGRDDVLEQGREELGVASRRLRDALAQLGTGWNEARVMAIDTSVAVRAEIGGRFRDLLDGTRRQLERAERDEAAAAATAARATADLEDLDRRLATLGASANQPSSGEAGGGPPPLGEPSAGRLRAMAPAAVVAVAGMALASALAIAGLLPAAAGVLAVALFTAAWLWTSRRPVDAALGSVDLVAARVAGLQEQRDVVARRAADAVGELEVAGRQRDDARAASDAAQAQWSAWLTAHHLDADLDREAAMAIVDAAATAREATSRRDDGARHVDRAARARAAFETTGQELLAALGRPVPPARPLGEALDRLQRDVQSAERAETMRLRLEEQVAEARVEEALAHDRRDHCEAELAALLHDCHAADEAELRRTAAQAVERARHEDRAASARETLLALSGPGGAFDEFVAEMAHVEDISERRDRLTALRDELTELGTKRDAVGEEIGALQHEVLRLETSVEASDRRQARADLVARLQAEAEEWSVRSLAAALLAKTRRTYEREHRPGVIRAAESYLADWTSGTYPRLVAPLGGSIEGLERQDGRMVPLAGLSRGTAEQLYLALRFGLIEHFADEAEPLPIVMDEILVNFDAARSMLAAQAVRRLAERHQVLYFTCHESTAGLLDPAGDRTLKLG